MTGRTRVSLRRVVLPLQLIVLALVGLFWPTPASTADAAVLSLEVLSTSSAPVSAMSMTNVAQVVRGGSNCTTATNTGVCATLFTPAATSFVPAGAPATNGLTITYTGAVKTSDFRLYVASYVPKTATSSSLCGAPDAAADPNNPASRIELQVAQGAAVIFPVGGAAGSFGTLRAFADSFNGPATGLQLRGGTNGSGAPGGWRKNDSSTFTVTLRLAASASNLYQGCRTGFDLVWFATQ